LGDSYLELVAVVDSTRAAETVFGRWVESDVSASGRPLGWAVRTPRLDEVARRLNLSVQAGSRTTPGGDELRWRTAGLDQAAAEPSLPFFIDWDAKTPFPGRAAVRHRAGNARISKLVIDGDSRRLTEWLGDQELPIVVREGVPALSAVYIASDSGEIVLGV
jgi:glyoxalase-like protein